MVEGEFKFQVDQEVLRLKAGERVTVFQNTPHAFVKTSEGMARLLVMHQPAGQMEEYFRTVIQQADQTIEVRARAKLTARSLAGLIGSTLRSAAKPPLTVN